MDSIRGTKTRARKSIPYVVAAACIVFYIFDLVGCVGTLESVFMASMSIGSGASLRIGHFGMCLHNSNSTANTCDQNSLAALDFASRFQKKVILPYILPIAGVLFVLGGLAMAVWEIGKRGKVVWKHITFVLLATSSSFAVSGAISTSMATGALALFSKAVAGPDVAQGATLQELEWTAVALQLLASGMFMAQARDLSGAKNVMGGNVLSNIGGSGLPL